MGRPKHNGKTVLGTTNRGHTKITSEAEIRLLFAKHLPFTLLTKEGRRMRENTGKKKG